MRATTMAKDEAMMKLYEHVRTGKLVGYTDLTDDQRREYMAEKNRQSRARQREAMAQGEPLPTKANIRNVLADAAIMLLATDGPGADQIRHVIAATFPSRPGLLLKVEQQAKSGRLRPKLVSHFRMTQISAESATPTRPATRPVPNNPASEHVVREIPVGAMTPEEIEATVPAFLRRGT